MSCVSFSPCPLSFYSSDSFSIARCQSTHPYILAKRGTFDDLPPSQAKSFKRSDVEAAAEKLRQGLPTALAKLSCEHIPNPRLVTAEDPGDEASASGEAELADEEAEEEEAEGDGAKRRVREQVRFSASSTLDVLTRCPQAPEADLKLPVKAEEGETPAQTAGRVVCFSPLPPPDLPAHPRTSSRPGAGETARKRCRLPPFTDPPSPLLPQSPSAGLFRPFPLFRQHLSAQEGS